MTETEIMHQKMVKAQAILLGGCEPEIINQDVFKVPSTNGNWDYTVKKNIEDWTCTCPLHQKLTEAGINPANCKHIHVIRFWLEMKEGLDTEYLNKQYRKQDFHGCPKCEGFDVIKNGFRKNKSGKKPMFICKECNKKFSLKDEGFENMKFSPEIVSKALDLYFKGTSLRKVADHIKQFHNVNISHVIIYYWIKRYTKIISEYVNELNPELGDMWATDEMAIRVKHDGVCWGRKTTGKTMSKSKWVWMWNVLDNETRFLIATMVSKKKKVSDATKLFKQAKDNAGKKPKVVTTDGLPVYHKAFQKVFWDHHLSCEHISEVGIEDKINNNRVERFHGSVRDRDKVMRAMHNPDTSSEMLDGFRAYYNYIRPHMALDGKTPAEMAGIDLKLGDNKWKGLIDKAVQNKIPELLVIKEKTKDKETMDYWL
ncbi:integrase core domain protein [archaeon BMS3Abin16]|nr:integrase core domain protein [archaeon BMS3Abin16]